MSLESGDDASLDPGLDIPMIPGLLRRQMRIETTPGLYLNMILTGLKESEIYEIRDLLIARGWLAG